MAEDSTPVSRELSLDEWLASLDSPDEFTCTWAFPDDRLSSEYLDSIHDRSDEEVRALLRHFLMPTGTLGSDKWRVKHLKHLIADAPEEMPRQLKREFVRRLLNVDRSDEPPWQGLTWILDLLPHWPMQAIEVLEAYFIVHAQELPDGRINGIADAQALIRAMWIGNPVSGAQKRALALQLGPRRFEHLIERLYAAMGFQTTLTPPGRDGGRDVIAATETPGQRQRTLVECKLWQQPVGVRVVRALLGVVSHERSTKGVVTTTSQFTRQARELARENARVELLGWPELLPLLDRYLGAEWGRQIDRHIADSVKRIGESRDNFSS